MCIVSYRIVEASITSHNMTCHIRHKSKGINPSIRMGSLKHGIVNLQHGILLSNRCEHWLNSHITEIQHCKTKCLFQDVFNLDVAKAVQIFEGEFA